MHRIRSFKIAKYLLLMIFTYAVEANSKSMDFVVSEPVCDGNAFYCLPYVDAKGVITPNTPAKFLEFIRKNKDEEFNKEIIFESNGGNLTASIELAYLIKENEYSTTVLGKCYSACAYAFLGGKKREINESAELGVHRFYSQKNLGDDNTQQMTAVLSGFLDTMKVDRKMLDIASLTDSKAMTLINRKKAIELNIINTVPKYSDWELKAGENGSVYMCSISTHASKKAMGYLCLFYSNNLKRITGKFLFKIDQKFRTNKDLLDIYDSHSDREISIILSNNSMDLKQTGWKVEKGNSFSTEFVIPYKLTLMLIKEKEFEITGNFSNFALDVEPKMQFSTKEFQNNLLAIVK